MEKKFSSPFERATIETSDDLPTAYTDNVITPRKRRMIDGYVRTGTFEGAAAASGYTVARCTKLIKNDAQVKREITKLVEQASVVSAISLERVLQEYGRLAFSNSKKILEILASAHGDSQRTLDLLKQLPSDDTAAISEINVAANGAVRVKMFDKKSALTDLGRMWSMFNDTLTIDDNTGFGARLERAIEKMEKEVRK